MSYAALTGLLPLHVAATQRDALGYFITLLRSLSSLLATWTS